MDVFQDALENLDRLKELATRVIVDSHCGNDKAVRDKAIDTVIQLRRTVIEANQKTERERTNLDLAALEESTAMAELDSLQSRIQTIDERIKMTEKQVEDQKKRAELEEANARLSAAKSRLHEKREVFEGREKKLKEYQRELAPAMKLGDASSITEFDHEERLVNAFDSLPRSLQFLYGQLRSVKSLFDLPIEVCIVESPKPPTRSMRSADSTESNPPPKKQRAPERKFKHGSDEKRRKKWYEAIMEKDSLSYEDWISPQRHLSASILNVNASSPDKRLNARESAVEICSLLTSLVEISKRQDSSKKQTKRKKNRGQPKPAAKEDRETATRFPLPVPKTELSVEVKLLDRDKELASLLFSWYHDQVHVASVPDWMLSRTIMSYDDAVLWEQNIKKAFPGSYRAVATTWAQELCGSGIFKSDSSFLTESDLKQMNEAMIDQHSFILEFLSRARSQALDLDTLRSGVRSLKEEASSSRTKFDPKKPHCIHFRQISMEKLSKPTTKRTGVSEEFAAGTWAVVMKKSVKLDEGEPMDTDQDAKPSVRIHFYPHIFGDSVRVFDKPDHFYEAVQPRLGSKLRLVQGAKLKSEQIPHLPEVLVGPLSEESSESKEDLVFGTLVVQKPTRILKQFSVLPPDHESRFFPFELQSRRQSFVADLDIPETEAGLYRVYRIGVQSNLIKVFCLMRVHLLRPLRPVLVVESVRASSKFKAVPAGVVVKDSRAKAAAESKGKAEYVKTERERVMKRETEAADLREALDRAALLLESSNCHSAAEKNKKRLPMFFSEDARRWITQKMMIEEVLTPQEAVRKLESLLEEWCRQNSKGVNNLISFLETEIDSKNKKRELSTRQRKSVKTGAKDRKEKKSDRTETRHEEELEQGEIPAPQFDRHAPRHRSTGRRDGRDMSYKARQRSRSPMRNRSTDPTDTPSGRNMRYAQRPSRLGPMRMDTEPSRDRSKGISSTQRPRR